MWRPFDWGVLRYLFVVAVFIVYHWWAAMAGAAKAGAAMAGAAA